MANFYVDISTDHPGTGHAGSKVDPYSYEDFVAAPKDSHVFYFRGQRSLTSTFTETSVSFQIKSWDMDEHGPWRIDGGILYGFNTKAYYEDGIIYAQRVYARGGGNRMVIYGLASTGNHIINGNFTNSLFIHVGNALTVSISGTGSFQADRCVFLQSSATSTSQITIQASVTCTISDSISTRPDETGFIQNFGTYTLSSITYSWSPPSIPLSSSTDLRDYALVGTPDVSTYGVGASGSWGERPITFYVDLSLGTTGYSGHYGDAPLGFDELKPFLEGFAEDGDTFKLKGEKTITGASYSLATAGTGSTISMVAWDKKRYGPWRINVSGSYDIYLGASNKNINVEGAVLYAGDDINFRGDNTSILNTVVNAGDAISVVAYTESTATYIYGCTFIASTYLIIDTGLSDYQVNIRDSLLDLPYVRGSAVSDTQLHAITEAVVDNGDGTYTAWFGYLNNTGAIQNYSVGSDNFFSPAPQDRGQVTTFLEGRYRDMFSVTWDGSTNLVWTLNGKTSTASTAVAVSSYTPNPGFSGSGGGTETQAVVSLNHSAGSAASSTVFNANNGTDPGIGGVTESVTEWGWVTPTWPTYDGRRYLFYYSKVLENISISGSGDYSSYSTGLWGAERTHIGAVSFERILYFDIDISNDGSRSDGTDIDQPANFYELLAQIYSDQGLTCKVRGARDTEHRHKDVFAYIRPELWNYKYVKSSTQYFLYNEYDLNEKERYIQYYSPNANTFMREGIGGEFDIIVDTDLNSTTNSLGFLISDPNIAPGSIYPYVEINIDGTSVTATYVDSISTTTTVTSSLTLNRVLLRIRRVLSGSDYIYYFEYNENLRASFESTNWVQIRSITLSTSEISLSNLEFYLERGTTDSRFRGIEIRADEGLEIPVSFITTGNEYVGNHIEAWDLENYGPWRIYAFQVCSNYTSFNDGIVETSSNDVSYPSYFCGSSLAQLMHTNMNLKVSDAGMILSSEGDVDPKGITLISSDFITIDDLRPQYLVESQTLNRSFFDDFNSDTWNSFWNTDVRNAYRLDSDNSRIEGNSSVGQVFFLTLSASVDWIYETQIFIRDTIGESTGIVVKLSNGDSYSYKWFSDKVNAGGTGTTTSRFSVGRYAFTTLQLKMTYEASTRNITWYFRFSPVDSWTQIKQSTIASVSTIDFGFDVAYNATKDLGHGFDWVYLQESGTTLPNDGFPFEMNFRDSTISASSINEGALSATKINSISTAFSLASAPAKGTHTNSKLNWSAPVQPSWDDGYINSTTAPIPDSWSYLTLKGDIPITFGTDSYLDYPLGLFGYERYGVGAYYFPGSPLDFSANPNPGYTNENIVFTPENDETATVWSWDFEGDGTIDSNNRIGVNAYSFDSVFDKFYVATLSILGGLPQTVTGIVGVRNRLDFGVDADPLFVLGFPASETVVLGVTGSTRPLRPSTFEWEIERNSSSYTAINGVTGLSINFTDGGFFVARLRADDYGVTGMPGNVQENVSSIYFEVINIAISVSPDKVSVGDTVIYQVTGDDVGSHTFRWRFGDSSYADGSSVSHQYSTGGIFDIELIIDRGTAREKTLSYDSSKANYDELRVTVSDLTVDFTIENEDGYPPLTGVFEDISDSALGLTGWEWFFTGPPGTPHIVGETGPIYIYDAEGIYYPYLRVTDLGGFQGIATGMIEVFSTDLDIKVYEGSVLQPEPVSKALPVTLRFEGVVDDESSISDWKWELIYEDLTYGEIIISDQQSAIKLDFNYTFSVPAVYKVRLTVQDEFSNTFTRTETITITENISIIANPENGFYPLNVDFSIQNIASPDPSRTKNEWDFTDDGVYDSTSATASYTYSSANTYTCRLRLMWEFVDKYTASKTAQISLEKTKSISVTYPEFGLGLSVTPTRGRKPLSVVMRGIANNPVSVWNWSIDGVSLAQTTQQINYTFPEEGTYVVTLSASDTFGQGPLTVQQLVYVSAELSTFDEAVDPADSAAVLELTGSADVVFLERGIGFSIPAGTDSVQASGFTTSKGITIIFD